MVPFWDLANLWVSSRKQVKLALIGPPNRVVSDIYSLLTPSILDLGLSDSLVLRGSLLAKESIGYATENASCPADVIAGR